MIKNWSVRNFKSLIETGDIEFPGLTLLAGANSSGKSSLLQSILLLKQTLQYGPESRPLLLNGPILKLGSFDDIRHSESETPALEFSFEIDLSFLRNQEYRDDWERAFFQLKAAGVESFKIDLSFKPKEDEIFSFGSQAMLQANSPPILNSTSISARKQKDGKHSIDETIIQNKGHERDFQLALSPVDEAILTQGKREVRIEYGWISHFLPSWAWLSYDAAYAEASQIASYLVSGDSILSRARKPSGRPSQGLIDALRRREEDLGIDLPATAPEDYEALKNVLKKSISRTSQLFRNSPASAILSGNSKQTELEAAIVTALLEELEPRRETDPVAIPDVDKIASFVRSYFKDGIRYIGPLRDAPKPVYQPEAMENTTNVGYRGEHTAAVLDINRDRTIRFFPPPDAADTEAFERPVHKVTTCLEAVTAWLSYLEVAEHLQTSDAGVYGNRLQVSPKGSSRLHDLTNVGVGVSQVLPIVVSSLLSSRGSTLIFEQPELHLHPRVQAKLADFFIAICLDQRQVLIETHSEYLVDRLRLRIAQARSDNILKRLSMIFTKKQTGRTVLSKVAVNDFGAIVNWPDDFFDQSQGDVEKILRAASKKRKLKQEQKR